MPSSSTRRLTAPRSRILRALLVATALLGLVVAGVAAPGGPAHAADRLLSQGAPVSASSVEGPAFPASAAVDGDQGTRWASRATDGEWLQVDLGATATLSRVDLSWEAAYAKAFRIQVSTDGTTFSTIADVTNGTGGKQSLAVQGSGRYVRMTGVTRATGYGYSLWELQVYGSTGAAASPTPTPTASASSCASGPADGKVRVAGSKGAWCLLVNGRPWTVKGMTWGPKPDQFETYWPQLRGLGVNTIRTWGTDSGSKALFDAAAQHGVRVVSGFWLGPGGGPGSGGCPDYVSDGSYKSQVLQDAVDQATAYKDNAGVLMWDVGNESILGLGGCYSGDRLEQERHAYASFVNDVAKRLHQVDPNHPVTSTDAYTGAWKYLKADAPDLDLYGLNTYGGICSVHQDRVDGGYTKPYLITESGPRGDWESPNDANGVPDQGTDAQNAAGYTNAWKCISGDAGTALGATLFHFGVEQDFNGVWFNVLPGGKRRLSYSAVAKAYGGPAAATGTNRPPTFSSMTVPASVTTGSTFTVHAPVSDPDGDALAVSVQLSGRYVNGDGSLTTVSSTRSGDDLRVTAPSASGVWKVYVVADDGRGNVGIETRSLKVVPPTPAGTDIAKGRTATASSFDPNNGDYTPGRAVDGDTSTRWASAWNADEWLQVDLGSVRSFSTVQLVWEAAYGKRYRIETSNDGSTWTTLATVTDGDGGTDQLSVSGSGRYVRMHGVERGTAYGYSLYELGVYA